jgi:hypothetical protein
MEFSAVCVPALGPGATGLGLSFGWMPVPTPPITVSITPITGSPIFEGLPPGIRIAIVCKILPAFTAIRFQGLLIGLINPTRLLELDRIYLCARRSSSHWTLRGGCLLLGRERGWRQAEQVRH